MDNKKTVWDYLISHGMTKQGAAGMMGNMQAESGISSAIVEYFCLQKLRENGEYYTQESYTAAVDSGKISKARFLNPLPNEQYGYGICQWTSPGRKSRLYDLVKKKKKSIGDMATQLEYLISELKTMYPDVWKTLSTTTNIQTASDTVLIKFESPFDQSDSVKKTRADYGKEIFNQMNASDGSKASGSSKPSSSGTASKESAIQKLLSIAEAEIGYLEKASNSQLDSKTANAGSGNFTKYWRDVYPQFNGLAWCACFVSWCFMKAFGLDTAKKLLKHWPYTYCPTLAGLTSAKTPKAGSVIIFYRNGEYAHTGIVTGVSGTVVYTIEGNTSGASGIVANGGGVCRKSYSISSLSSNTKYFMPDYSIVSGVVSTTTAKKESTKTKKSSGGLNEIPKWKAKVTASELNVRTWAGAEYDLIKSYPVLKKGDIVEACDSVKASDGVKWFFIRIAGEFYGFVYGAYIKKIKG